MASRRKVYLLQNCGAGLCGNLPLFWKAGGSGYTPWPDEAKRWTYPEARTQIRESRGSHRWKMWDVMVVEACLRRVADIQDLGRCERASRGHASV